MTKTDMPLTRLAKFVVPPLVAAVVAPVVIEQLGLFATFDRLDELTGLDWVWVFVLTLLAVLIGGVLAERLHASRARHGDPHAAPSIAPEAAEQAYRPLAIYAEIGQKVLLAARSGFFTARSPSDIVGEDVCLSLPAKQMSGVLGTEVLLSVWSVVDDQFRIASVPGHPLLAQIHVPADDSWVVRRTSRWRDQDPPLVHDGTLNEDDALLVLTADLRDYENNDDALDLAMLYSLGHQSFGAVPLTLGDENAWLIALTSDPVDLTTPDERFLRTLAIALELSSSPDNDDGSPRFTRARLRGRFGGAKPDG
jgi:hypothetical protein